MYTGDRAVLCAAVEMAELDAVEQQVHDYYESNTKRFLRFGQGASESVIRRALWGPGVETQQQAFHYVEELILGHLRSLAADGARQLQVVDMGCGAGASLSYLAQRCAFQGLGITLSPVQVQLAKQLWTARDQDRRARRARRSAVVARATLAARLQTGLARQLGDRRAGLAVASDRHHACRRHRLVALSAAEAPAGLRDRRIGGRGALLPDQIPLVGEPLGRGCAATLPCR